MQELGQVMTPVEPSLLWCKDSPGHQEQGQACRSAGSSAGNSWWGREGGWRSQQRVAPGTCRRNESEQGNERMPPLITELRSINRATTLPAGPGLSILAITQYHTPFLSKRQALGVNPMST